MTTKKRPGRWAEFIRDTSKIGRSRRVVRCACGATNEFFKWSWGGHGKARCYECGCWIMYWTLEVLSAAELAVRVHSASTRNHDAGEQ